MIYFFIFVSLIACLWYATLNKIFFASLVYIKAIRNKEMSDSDEAELRTLMLSPGHDACTKISLSLVLLSIIFSFFTNIWLGIALIPISFIIISLFSRCDFRDTIEINMILNNLHCKRRSEKNYFEIRKIEFIQISLQSLKSDIEEGRKEINLIELLKQPQHI